MLDLPLAAPTKIVPPPLVGLTSAEAARRLQQDGPNAIVDLDGSSAGAEAYAGALVRRGESVGEVVATGSHTKFGRTAELVRSAKVDSSQQKAILRVVRDLALLNDTDQ